MTDTDHTDSRRTQREDPNEPSAAPGREPLGRHDRLVELALATIVVVSTLAFAWAGFQGSQWVRERFLLSDEASALGEDAAELTAEAARLEELDVSLILQWLAAIDSDEPETAALTYALMRPVVHVWIAEHEVGRSDEPPAQLLVDDPDYDVNRLRRDAAELGAETDRVGVASRQASRTGARYGGLALVFAISLAAASSASRFAWRRLRLVMVISAGVLLVIGLTATFNTPINLT